MSLILDALNKADRERQNTEAPPGIHSIHEVREFNQKKRLWLYLVPISIAIVILAVLVWQLVTPDSTPEVQAVNTVVNEVDPLKKSTRIPGLPKPVLVKEEKQIPINKPAVDELYSEKEIPTAAAVTNSTPDTTQLTSNAENQLDISDSKSTTESGNTSPQEIQTTASTVETPPSTPPVTPTSLSDFPQIGTVGDLPWTIINTLPSLNYSQHVYRGSQSESYVVLNDQRKREGQSLTESIRVEHILRDGIILAYKEYQFKLRALNSWVNI